MGCDIHAFIETFSKQENAKNDMCYVDCFSGEVSFGRDYVLFGMLAGVRHSIPPVFRPRGIPNNPCLSDIAANRYFMKVLDSSTPNNSLLNVTGSNCISREGAEVYVSEGTTTYTDDSNSSIIDPSWHTPTWLTLDELLEVRKVYLIEIVQYYSKLSGKKIKELVSFLQSKDAKTLMRYSFPPYENTKFYATLCAMLALERSSDDNDIQSRLVCWFDS